MKYKITNKTGMKVSYKKIPFAPKESKILELESVYEHEYFLVEKLKITNSLNSLNRKKLNKTEVK